MNGSASSACSLQPPYASPPRQHHNSPHSYDLRLLFNPYAGPT